jgi:hypothetical protein
MAMAELHDDELACPRCGRQMTRGFLDAGNGPLRWVTRADEHFWIFGGEHLARRRNPFWGRFVVPAARCINCRVGVFAYDG